MKILLKNYEIHVNDFLKKMVNNPIKLNNYKTKSMTTRQELFANSANKILDKTGFSFKNFKTDKERIQSYIQKNEIKYDDSNNKNDKNRKLNLKKIFLEPNNDNKREEDFKKIFNIFTHNEELNDEEKIFYEKLKNGGYGIDDYKKYDSIEDGNNKININNIFQDKKDILKIINDTSLTDEEKYKKLLHNKIYNERKDLLFLRKLKLKYSNKLKKLNKTNSNFFSKKTNFKAMENLTLFKSPIIKHKINKTLSSKEIFKKEKYKQKNLFNKTAYKFRKINYINNDGNNSRKYSIDINLDDLKNHDQNFSNIFSSKNPLNDIPIRKEIVRINPLLFQYNINYIKNINNKTDKDKSFKDKIISLKKMAFEKKENIYEMKYEKSIYEIIKENEEILIDGQKFKKIDIDKIADKLLKKCNYKPNINKTSKKHF